MKDKIKYMDLFTRSFMGLLFKSVITIALDAILMDDKKLDENIKKCIEIEDHETLQILLAEFGRRSLENKT